MKTRILFLDDEPLALQGLQRMLRSMRSTWDLEFAESGFQALDRMAQLPFHIVVTDMLMPGMNGAQFLQEVRKRHPDTIRLILSGHAERDLILQCLASAHQYLSKPCPAETLKATLQRAAHLTATLEKNASLRRIVSQLDRFPSIPALYIDLVETLLGPDVSLDAVARLVVSDLGLTAAVLRFVNSAFFGAPRQIANAVEALSCLGLDTFKMLVFHINAFSQFDPVKYRECRLEAMWEHSLEVAKAARRIAEMQQADPRTIQEAYTGGLLHDIGKFVILVHFPDSYETAAALAKEQKTEMWHAEREVFGVSHVDVGAYLLGLWGLPAALVEAVAWHHAPSGAPPATFSPLTAVHVANALVQARCRPQREIPFSEVDANYLAQLGLLERLGAWRQAVPAEPSA